MSVIAKITKTLLSIVVILMCCVKPPANNKAKDMTATLTKKEKAIKVAQDTAASLSYKLENMNTVVTFHDKPWNEFFPKESNDDYDLTGQKALEGKPYWAVYFSPNLNTLGGDICVFIDTTNGKVLTLYRGK